MRTLSLAVFAMLAAGALRLAVAPPRLAPLATLDDAVRPREALRHVGAAPEIVLDASSLGHEFLGFGLGIHPSDVTSGLLAELRPRFVRMEVGPEWNHLARKIPTGCDPYAMDRYIAEQFDADSPERLSGARWAFKVLESLGAKVILVNFELPWHWLAKDDPMRTLEDARVEDWARFWVSLLLFLKQHGMVPFAVELTNEPDGHWNGHVPPDRYARLVTLVRAELDRRGIGQVRLLGPGLAYLRREDDARRYVAALGDVGARALWGWSTHAWDEVDYPRARVEFADGVWRPLLDAVASLPARPMLVTEYATEVTTYRGVDYASPRAGVSPCASDTPEYAVRVLANSLVHANRGAGALVLYRLADHDWHRTRWGLVRRPADGAGERPLAELVRMVWPRIPDGARLVRAPPLGRDDPMVWAAWRAGSRLVFVAANATDDDAAAIVRIRGLVAPRIDDAELYGPRGRERSFIEDCSGECWGFRVRLAAHSASIWVVTDGP